MRSGWITLADAVGLWACGGSSKNDSGGGGLPTNIWSGAVTVGAGPAGACATPQMVTFTAAGADIHTVTIPGGGCIKFQNNDTVPHQPASYGPTSCPELTFASPIPAAAPVTIHRPLASAGFSELIRNQEVGGSIPPSPTKSSSERPPIRAAFLFVSVGFVGRARGSLVPGSYNPSSTP